MGEEKSTSSTIGGAPISWVALMGALLGAGSIIPLVINAEGGGYQSLSYGLMGVVACLLGPWGAGAAATIGYAIAFFLAPGTTLGSIFINYAGPAVMAGLILTKKWKWAAMVAAIGIVFYELVPWYWPSDPRFGVITQPFLAISVWYDALSLPLILTVGRNMVPEWIKSSNKTKMFFGLMLLHWMAAESMHLFGWAEYLMFYYPVQAYVVAVVMAVAVPFQRVMIQAVSAIIGVPLLLSLRKSGLRKIPGAVW